MPRTIIKIKDKYFEWSTVVDAPTTYGMTEKELYEFVRSQYGEEGVKALPARLERVNTKGTSSYIYKSLADQIKNNHAGKDGKCLTEDEIYAG